MRPVNRLQVTGSRLEGAEQGFKNRDLGRFPWASPWDKAGFKVKDRRTWDVRPFGTWTWDVRNEA
jgi:hypothetical protein